MAEELQSLISRIQSEGVAKAQKEAEAIKAEAKQRAVQIVKQAHTEAAAKLKEAEEEAALFQERAGKTLEQAARDLLITVGRGTEKIMEEIVRDAVREALPVSVLENMLVKVVEAYVADDEAAARIDLLISEDDQKELTRFFRSRFRRRLEQGLDLRPEGAIDKGFKVSYKDTRLTHDFTAEAIAEALMNFLRPDLGEIVHRVARESAGDKTK
ncbi:MAG: hypothetical protein ABR497_01060 [Kiritimatiellia bacterium]